MKFNLSFLNFLTPAQWKIVGQFAVTFAGGMLFLHGSLLFGALLGVAGVAWNLKTTK